MKNPSTKIVGVVLLILALALPSCNPVAPAHAGNPPLPISEPIPPRITITPCPFVTPFVVNNIEQYQNRKVIYILVDKSGSYKHLTDLALERISQSLSKAINPGDYVYIGWIGENVTKPESLFFQGEVSYIGLPNSLLATTSTPDINDDFFQDGQETETESDDENKKEPEGTLTTFEQIAVTRTANAIETVTAEAATSIAATKTANQIATQESEKVKQCEFYYSNEQRKSDFTVFEQSRNGIIESYANAINQAISNSSRKSDLQTYVYESLYIASRILQDKQASGTYNQVKLIIFSDMEETGSSPNGLSFNFNNIDVTIAMAYCEKAIHCENIDNTWIPFFTNHGANPPKVKLVQESSVDTLVEIMTSKNPK
jgi:hypothetical protein